MNAAFYLNGCVIIL